MNGFKCIATRLNAKTQGNEPGRSFFGIVRILILNQIGICALNHRKNQCHYQLYLTPAVFRIA